MMSIVPTAVRQATNVMTTATASAPSASSRAFARFDARVVKKSTMMFA